MYDNFFSLPLPFPRNSITYIHFIITPPTALMRLFKLPLVLERNKISFLSPNPSICLLKTYSALKSLDIAGIRES